MNCGIIVYVINNQITIYQAIKKLKILTIPIIALSTSMRSVHLFCILQNIKLCVILADRSTDTHTHTHTHTHLNAHL